MLGRTKKTFRDGSYYRHVIFGKRTVKEGECAAIWTPSGNRKMVEGPKRVRLWFSHVRFLDRHVADGSQYILCQFRDGRKEHVRGPAAIFFDPCVHQLLEVQDAYKLAANEALVVYAENTTVSAAAAADGEVPTRVAPVVATKRDSQEGAMSVVRRIVKGPAVFIPTASEWVHTFSWHGSPGSGSKAGTGSKTGTPGDTKLPHALTFQKLRSMPDQMYYSVKDVRTADDAQLTVHLMIFYELVDIEKMLDSSNDPIGDFINAASADAMTFAANQSYESFLANTSSLSEVAAFPILAGRMAADGFRLLKVVYRGYTTCEQLQKMHNTAIAQRTELRLQSDTLKEQEAQRALELQSRQERSRQEQALQQAEAEHELALAQKKNEAARLEADAVHAQALRHEREKAAIAAEQLRATTDEQLRRAEGLKGMGVDLTKYLCAVEMTKPDKHIRVDAGAAPALHFDVQ